MILDFVFGGETYLTHNRDTINELGHHEFKFKIANGSEILAFRRGTGNPDSIRTCDLEYLPLQIITLAEYTTILKGIYKLDEVDCSFREMVSLYSRIWGKENAIITKPLHNFTSQKAPEAVEILIKIFNKYSTLKSLTDNLHVATTQKSYLQSAQKGSYIPKITKTQYNANANKQELIKSEITGIKNELAKYAANIREIVNREVLELKIEKDSLLDKKMAIESKLLRVSANLNSSRHIKSRSFKQLKEFFPDINVDRLEKVELFHSRISQILKNELEKSKSDYSLELDAVIAEIATIEEKMKSTVTSVENPGAIIDRTFGLISQLNKIDLENSTYTESIEIAERSTSSRNALNVERKKVLDEIAFMLNDEMRKIAQQVYGGVHKSPNIGFTDSNYQFDIYEDTGTGKAFSNLLIFDMAILKLSQTPFLIHDSFLFKNIQNTAIAGLIKQYLAVNKQSFIAIDEIAKYGAETSVELDANSVVKLTDSNTLYIKDWRK